jgi:hypothetical protein
MKALKKLEQHARMTSYSSDLDGIGWLVARQSWISKCGGATSAEQRAPKVASKVLERQAATLLCCQLISNCSALPGRTSLVNRQRRYEVRSAQSWRLSLLCPSRPATESRALFLDNLTE